LGKKGGAVRDLTELLTEIRACRLCAEHLPLGPNPVLQAAQTAKILIVGQAPGIRVHRTGLPFNDPSGDRLRDWLGIDRDQFYDPALMAIVPMGFCYPGRGKSGDLPPRPECAATWRAPLMASLANIRLTVVIGRYAIAYHLPDYGRNPSVTNAVANWRSHWPDVIPLPHPSPRNNLWLRRNAWFDTEIVPALRSRVAEILS
jgi:uracil-DNA glycosylase